MAERTGIAYVHHTMPTLYPASRYGPPAGPARDGDKKQARARVNRMVQRGVFPHPNSLPCEECGHVWHEGEKRHEYDHHLGYDALHQLDVEVVCPTCNKLRAVARGEIKIEKLKAAAAIRRDNRKTHCVRGHPMSYGNGGVWRCYECRREWYRTYRIARRAEGKDRG